MKRPSVLWVTGEVPDRHGGGGSIRQANLLTRLAAELDIHLVALGPVVDPDVRASVRSVTEVQPPPAPRPRFPRLRAAWTLWVRRQAMAVHGSMAERRLLGAAVAARRAECDAVVLHHTELLPLLPLVEGTLTVVHLFDVRSARAERMAALATTARAARLWRAEARALRRVEGEAIRRADVVVTCAAADRDLLLRIAGSPVRATASAVVVPNGVELDRFEPVQRPEVGRVLFLGSLDYDPNIDGIRWFVEAVWPQVRAAAPVATLAIVGHRPPPAVRELADQPGVEVVGDVPEAAPWFAASDVVVVPLRIGTGTRLKALEAMATGRPVVGTTIGLEGLGLEGLGIDGAPDGAPPALVADHPGAFAAAVTRMLGEEGAAVGAAGRSHVEAHFGWDPPADHLAAALQEALAHRAERRARG